jgi:hypothetical protein
MMAKTPSHYRITVNRPLEFFGARLRPGARYTVKAAVYDALRATHPEAIASADPMRTE